MPASGGELVKVAWARNQAEAELIQGLLREQGIPSIERRARGFDVPDFLAAGPREVLVPVEAGPVARELLGEAELGAGDRNGSGNEPDGERRALRLAAGLLLALIVAAGLVLGFYELA